MTQGASNPFQNGKVGSVEMVPMEEWVGETGIFVGLTYKIVSCDRASSNLPYRDGRKGPDGQLQRTQLRTVYLVVLTEPEDPSAAQLAVFGCSYCGAFADTARAILDHQVDSCQVAQDERSKDDDDIGEPTEPRRTNLPREMNNLTIADLAQMFRASRKLVIINEDLRRQLAAERARRKELEKGLSALRGLVSSTFGEKTPSV